MKAEHDHAAAGWASLHGCPLAIMEEVVEHLDPAPLAALPAALLRGLRPQRLVMTTPNAEYNSILHTLGGKVWENGMRNSDHRFEWCATLHPLLSSFRRMGPERCT